MKISNVTVQENLQVKKGFVLIEILIGLLILSGFILQFLHVKQTLFPYERRVDCERSYLVEGRGKLLMAMTASLNYLTADPSYRVEFSAPYYRIYLRTDNSHPLKNLYVLRKVN